MRRTAGISLAFGAAIVFASAVDGSVISTPSVGPADVIIGNLNSAEPREGESILLHNPAGIADLGRAEVRVSTIFIYNDGKYANPDTGYDAKSAEVPMAPVVWFGMRGPAGWNVGGGLYGTTGASFNFPGNPALGIENRFFSELSVVQFGLVAGREIAPGLRVGLQIAPTYSAQKLRVGTPLGPVRFDLSGFGIGGTVGLLYDLGRSTTFGVGYRAPGIVWNSGDADVGENDDRVDFDFHLPQQVTFGFAHRRTERLTVYAHARWSDYTEFEKSIFDFEETDALDQSVIPKAKDRFRFGGGVAYQLTEELRVAVGGSREEWMMEEESLSPLLYDTSDILLGAGFQYDSGSWQFDAMVGRPIIERRIVTADRNPRFPGRYEAGEGGGVAGFAVTYRFPAPE